MITAPRAIAGLLIVSACRSSALPASAPAPVPPPDAAVAPAADPLCEPLLAIAAAAAAGVLGDDVSLPGVGPCKRDGSSLTCELGTGDEAYSAYTDVNGRVRACLPDGWSNGEGLMGNGMQTMGYDGPDGAGVGLSYSGDSAWLHIDGPRDEDAEEEEEEEEEDEGED